MSNKKVLRILIAPLDWGMGHATRCIPIINHIVHLGHIPVIAGNKSQRDFLSAAFPTLECLNLDGYNIVYSKTRKGFLFRIMTQLPGILRSVKKEKEWLNRVVADNNIDAVISDNRYGLYHPNIPCVVMTHQLGIRSGLHPFVDRLIRFLHYQYLSQFDTCWVVDTGNPNGLGGSLSYQRELPHGNTRYIGLLSQCTITEIGSSDATRETTGSILVLLSGPEPQRTLLSSILWQQVVSLSVPVVFVEGSESAPTPSFIPEHVTYFKRIASVRELSVLISGADIVVARSGYSTIMDLAFFGKKAILIPTPGQTEQEYLARYLNRRGIFYSVTQKSVDLRKALKDIEQFPYFKLFDQWVFDSFKTILEKWLAKTALAAKV